MGKAHPEEKEALYQRDHSIGNHNGMPTVDRDYYNRLALGDELNQAQAAQARADALGNQHPDWAQGQNIPPPNKPGAIFDDRLKYEAWQRQYTDALNGAKYLPDLQAVDKAVKDNPNRKLMLLDTHSGSQARAAIAIGDPDTAQHVSVTTPGLNTTVHGSIGSMTGRGNGPAAGIVAAVAKHPWPFFGFRLDRRVDWLRPTAGSGLGR